jgi:GMP synthase (glutamine-hydrolysing)
MSVVMTGPEGEVLGFTVGEKSLGVLGHVGMKSGMAEDLIMEFGETPDDTLSGLTRLGQCQMQIAEALGPFMVALVKRCGLM